MITEKRKYLRFQAREGAYAAAFGKHFTKVGKLKDISLGGLAFTYIDNTEDFIQDSSKVTIFISENEFYLSDLACKLIYDSSQQMTNNIQYSGAPFRINRCGVQFTAITKYQLDKLKLFITHHARRLTLL